MTENSRLFGSRPGADALRSASATHSDDSLLKNAVSGGNLSFAEASIGRISVEIFAETDPPQNVHLVRCRESRPDDESLDRMQNLMFQTLYFEELAVGMRETISKTVANEDVIGFAELSGDHNPIHLSEHFANTFRRSDRPRALHGEPHFRGIGMRLPGPGAVYISQTLNFLGPVKIGDVVDVSVEVVELTEKGRRVRLQCECRVGDKIVLEGQGVLSVPLNPK